jgi:hypothetical protein
MGRNSSWKQFPEPETECSTEQCLVFMIKEGGECESLIVDEEIASCIESRTGTSCFTCYVLGRR